MLSQQMVARLCVDVRTVLPVKLNAVHKLSWAMARGDWDLMMKKDAKDVKQMSDMEKAKVREHLSGLADAARRYAAAETAMLNYNEGSQSTRAKTASSVSESGFLWT